MKLSELKAKGGFVSAGLVKRSVTWERRVDGEDKSDTFDVFVKRQSFGVVESIWSTPEGKSRSAEYISQCVFLGAKGDERLTHDDALALDPGLAAVLINAANAVNGTGKDAEKNSPPPTSSGTT